MTETKSKATKTKAAKGTTGWRSNYAPTAKVKLLVKANPHRAGTKDHGKWKKVRSGATVQTVVKAGIDLGYLRYMEKRGLVEIAK